MLMRLMHQLPTKQRLKFMSKVGQEIEVITNEEAHIRREMIHVKATKPNKGADLTDTEAEVEEDLTAAMTSSSMISTRQQPFERM